METVKNVELHQAIKPMNFIVIKAFLCIIFITFCSKAIAQNFPVEIIRYNDSPDKMVNLVLMGDGYTKDQQDKFINDVNTNIQGMMLQEPWKTYADRINVYAIKVVSNVAGAANRPTEPIDNYFGSSFNTADIDRLLYPTRINKVIGVLNSNTPFFDIGVIMVNDNRYGGGGGLFATFSTHPDAMDIMIHELGHTFTSLADEYWAGIQFARELANMTQNRDPESIRWKNFLGQSQVSIFPHAESPTWFRPHQNCKMRFLLSDFCAVCMNEINTKIETLTIPAPMQRPIAFFGAEQLEIFEGHEVQFLDLSSQSPNAWLWTFEGGVPENSETQNPSVTYNHEGFWRVSLSSSNSLGTSNISRDQYIIVKKDTEPPLLRVKNQTIDLDEFGKAQITVNQIDDGTTDNVGIRELILSQTEFDCSNVGENQVTFKAIDVNGNESSALVNVIVRDRIAPVAKSKDFTLILDEEGNGTILPEDLDDGSFDNCGIVSLSVSKSTFGREDSGDIQVRLIVKDESGNESTATSTVRVEFVLFAPKEQKEKVVIYPNPSQGFIQIAYPKIVDPTLRQIEILDSKGTVLLNLGKFDVIGNVIPVDVSGFSNGIYFVRLTAESGVQNLKFSVKK